MYHQNYITSSMQHCVYEYVSVLDRHQETVSVCFVYFAVKVFWCHGNMPVGWEACCTCRVMCEKKCVRTLLLVENGEELVMSAVFMIFSFWYDIEVFALHFSHQM